MEHIQLALPEDGSQAAKELNVQVLELLIRLLLAYLKDKLINVATDSVSIGPFAHLEGKLELLLTDLQDKCNL